MTIASMTGYADRAGSMAGIGWTWEARSVNGRGLDIRLRLPEGAEGLDPAIRQAAAGSLARGNVTITLRLARREEAAAAPKVNRAALEAALDAARLARDEAERVGLALAPPGVGDLLAVPGVFAAEAEPGVARPEVQAALAADVAPLVAALAAARRAEGAVIAGLLEGRVAEVARLAAAAREVAEARAARTGALLRERVAALLEAQAGLDEGRLAQELALIAVKADVTEELDRLGAHVEAARALLAQGGAVGRKLDFLMQEFNREANTLCAKAQSAELTALGLELKVVIDQMREQVQNVE
jgi:uncharacterized protein (TIGR00255 family)